MSRFSENCMRHAQLHPDRDAFRNSAGDHITYAELDAQSDALACYLDAHVAPKEPVVMYGHKGCSMLTCMFACMKSGRPYVPVDTSFPASRIDAILGQLDDALVLCTAPLDQSELEAPVQKLVAPEELAAICAQTPDAAALAALTPIEGDDANYILFTSGSTGKPKGVVQRAESIDLTSDYFATLLPEPDPADPDAGIVLFNRAPFSFDLSLFDFLIALPYGNTMFALEKEAEYSLAMSFEALRESDLTLWVSTPSFLNMCLADPSFGPELLPKAKVFLMCGETLHNATAAQFMERFPEAVIVNMYGPTETCGAVTDVTITPEMAADANPLPVGTPSAYSQIIIADPETLKPVPDGQEGEILILGNTAASGYYQLPEKTAECFFTMEDPQGVPQRCYRTGDAGFISPDGQLQYRGRFDLQLKLNGYRIELGDIEENLNTLPSVAASCVVPVMKNGMITALAAHIVPAHGVTADRTLTKQLKEELKELLPAYMIPRTFKYHDVLPTNVNGKIDRKALTAMDSRS